MPQTEKQRKKGKKTKKTGDAKDSMRMKLHFMPEDDVSEEDEESEKEFQEGGMILEKEDVQLIYNALKKYKPTEEEEVLYWTLLESFEETLVVDYGMSLPDVVY